MTVEVYSKPACAQCTATYRAMDKKNIEYKTIDISQDTAAYDKVVELGFQAAPVVLVLDEDGEIVRKWSGFDPDEINGLA